MSDISTPPPPAPDPNPPTPTNTTGLTRNVAAGIACVFTLVGGVVFLVLEKKDAFVRFWAMQSVFLGGLMIAVQVFLKIAYLVFSLIPFLGKVLNLLLGGVGLLFTIAWFVAYVITIIKAFTNEEWEIPWLGKLARAQLARMEQTATPPPAA